MRGGFSLVRLPNKPKEKRENWLLVKEPDGYAVGSGNPVGQWTTSVATGCGLMQIGGGAPRASATQMQREDARSRMPRFVAPQLAMLASAPPAGEDWVHEIKYDGYRAIAAIAGGRARIFTRSGQDWTDKFATIAAALCELDVSSALLDGEIVALDDRGISSFRRLQNEPQERQQSAHLFRLRPARARRARLAQGAADPPQGAPASASRRAPAGIRYSDHVVGGGEKVLGRGLRPWAGRHRVEARHRRVSVEAHRRLAQVQVHGQRGVRHRRLPSVHQERPSLRLAAARRVQGQGAHVSGPRRHGLRCRQHARPRGEAGAARAQDVPVRRCRSRGQPRRPLGRAAARRAGRLHRAHERRPPAPPLVPRIAGRQAGARGPRAARQRTPRRPTRRVQSWHATRRQTSLSTA